MRNPDNVVAAAPEICTITDRKYRELEKMLSPAIESTARALARGDRDLQDDVDSAGRLALLDALERFNPQFGVPLIPFALRHIRLRQLDAYRDEKRVTDRFVLFSDLPTALAEDVGEADAIDTLLQRVSAAHSNTFSTQPNEQTERAETVENFITTLPRGLRGVAHRLYREGFSQAEVAREFRVTRAAIGKAAKRVHGRGRTSRALSAYNTAA